MEKSTGRRPSLFKRQFYIKQEFQRRFILLFLATLVVGGLISMGLIYSVTQDTLTSTFDQSRLSLQPTALAIMPSVFWTTVATTLVVGGMVGLLTLLVSHRIAGPMFRFESDLKRMGEGDLSHRVRIRKGDQFQDLATALNSLAQGLNTEIRQLSDGLSELEDREDLTPEARAHLTRVREDLQNRFTL